jgi:formate hydrogenlyase subunit 6/NADH:ubiquinone oxidoreductase subunit I
LSVAVDEHDVRRTDGEPSATGAGLVKGLAVTLKHMLRPAITQQYPEVKPDLPARSRGVIALKQENCTVCYKCSRECPDWCIYIDAHKETNPPASGGKARSVKVLDRFAIDFSLCMYCGICVEVCPFDALFWSPEFEYSTYSILDLVHEKDKLEEWTYHVLPPPALEVGAEPPPEPAAANAAASPATAPAGAAAAPAPQAVGAGVPAAAPAPMRPVPAAPTPERVTPNVAEAGAQTPAEAAPGPTVAGDRQERVEVQPDQETFDRVLAEELAKGTDRRVAEGKARRAGMIEARKKAAG